MIISKRAIAKKHEPESICVDFDGTLAVWAPYPKIGKPKDDVITKINQLHDDGYKIIISSCRFNTKSHIPVIKKWLDENNYGMILARDFSHDHAVEFLRSRELNNTSINYYRDQLKSLFELMRREKKIRDNPFDGIPKLKENRQGKLPYREDQINELKTRITLQYPILWLHIEFIAYCGIRTNELRLLKIANIDFQSQQIFIPGDISKNGQTEYVDIPNQFYKKLLLLKMDKMRSENYVFSKRGLGVSNVPWSRDHFSKMHKEVLLQAGITDPHYSLYSWKSTGAIRAVRSGVGIKDLQKQWRHKHISTTDIYLQSIGAYPNEEIRTKIPEL